MRRDGHKTRYRQLHPWPSPAVALAAVALVALLVPSVSGIAQQEDSSVTGFIRYARGEGIPDLRVWIIVPGERSVSTTRTGLDGSYLFEKIPPGDYYLSASQQGAIGRGIRVIAGEQLRSDFSIPDGSTRRAVTGRVVMNESSKSVQRPGHIGSTSVMRADGTVVIPLEPGDHLVPIRLPESYYLDSVTYGATTLYSAERVGRRLSAANFLMTVPPEPVRIPVLTVTLGSR